VFECRGKSAVNVALEVGAATTERVLSKARRSLKWRLSRPISRGHGNGQGTHSARIEWPRFFKQLVTLVSRKVSNQTARPTRAERVGVVPANTQDSASTAAASNTTTGKLDGRR